MVTGASSGIGEALAERLAAAGVAHLILVARREDRLEALASRLAQQHGTRVDCVVADLSTHDGLALAVGAGEGVDLLVNNAGVGGFGRFDRLSPRSQGTMIDLNCRAPVHLAGHLLPSMIEQGRGCILNIASGQSFGAMPFMSTYAATKSFLLHWAEGVRAELNGTGVHVVTVCPGAIATGFNQAAAIPEADLAAISLVTGSMDGVVASCMQAITRNRGISIPGFRNWIAVTIGRLSPRAISAWLLAAVLRSGAQRAAITDQSSSDPR